MLISMFIYFTVSDFSGSLRKKDKFAEFLAFFVVAVVGGLKNMYVRRDVSSMKLDNKFFFLHTERIHIQLVLA